MNYSNQEVNFQNELEPITKMPCNNFTPNPFSSKLKPKQIKIHYWNRQRAHIPKHEILIHDDASQFMLCRTTQKAGESHLVNIYLNIVQLPKLVDLLHHQ